GRRTEGTRFGWGWRLSACQELKASGKTDFPYEYIDGDGTSHYFYKDTDDGNKLKDENGLGYVITQESSSDTEAYRIIETKDKYQMIFAQDGFLRKEKDPNGNTITYTYARDTYGLHLSKITDPTGAEITLEYDKNHLVRMTDPAGRVTSYTYEAQSDELETYPKRIDTITYPDGKVTTFDYDTDAKTSAGAADRNKLISVRAADGYEINYEYVTDYTVQRVSRITEKNGDSIGQELKISYKNGNTTVFEECGLDGDVDAADDNRTCTYQFDNNGRPVCVINNDGTAESFGYYSEGAKNNKLSKSGSTQKTIVNHMRNIRIERALNHWTTCGGDTAAVERTEEKGYIGTCSAKIIKTGNAGESGIMQDHTLSPGTYTLSAYVCVEELGDGGVFHLTAKGVNADGTEEVLNTSSGITARTDNAVDNGWLRESVTFTVDDTHTGVNVYATIGNAVGIAYVTCFQLEEGTVANKFNLLENGSFEKMGDTQDIPSLYNWQETESGDGRVTGDFPFGNCAVHIKGAIGKRKGYYQSISLKADPNMVFSVSGWAKANAIPEQEFRIILGFWFTDGTYFFEDIPFNTNITDWQFVHQMVSPHKGKYKDKTLSTLVFYFFYGQNQNDAYFDGFQITCDDEESFVYDDKGNLVSAASAAEKSGFNFDGNDNLSKMTDATGESSEYAYDDKKNLIMAHNSEGVRCRFAYNEYGNPVYSTIQSNSRMGAVTPGRLYYIRERVSGKYLNAKSSGAASGTNCVLDSYSGSSAQKW
ncbi:MAG: carbohydrate binding domain-containing protein, partial [Lachnospiraceae bacterium]|nr:carbohydrate binding domain-containing protein [Lachnospiraceae bacterium]